MSVFAAVAREPGRLGRAVGAWGAPGLTAVVLGLVLGLELSRRPPSLALAVGGGIGLVVVLALALWRYDWAAGLGIVLLFFVRKEPAPADAVFLIAIAVAIATGRFTVHRVPAVINALVGAYLTLTLISLTFVVDPSRAIRFSFITFYLAFFALWLPSWLRSQVQARIVARAYVFAAALSALLGTAAYVGGPGRGTFLEYGGTRAVGLYKDPNVFGAFLVPAALIVIDELFKPKLLKGRWPVKVAIFVLLMLGIVFSFSRAAWINFALGVLVMIVVFALRRGSVGRALKLLFSVAGAVVVVAVVLAATGSIGFLQSRAHVQSYDSKRFGAQQEGLQLVAHHPFGVGPGQFELYAPLSAHSTYVRAVAELGILGLAVVLAFVLVTLVLAVWNAGIGRETYGIGSAPLLGAWAGLLLSGFVIDTIHWRHLWLVAALIWTATMRPLRARTA